MHDDEPDQGGLFDYGSSLSDEPAKVRLDAVAQCREAALRLLNYRMRSVAELRRRLTEGGHDEALVDQVVERLLAAGLLDDEAFAAAYVRDGVNLKKRGRWRLLRELRSQGIDESVAEAALDEELPADTERAMAARVASARADKLRGLPREVAMRRLASYLERRGIGTALVWELVKEAFPREGAE
jgi:regulatory protein